MTKHVRGCVLKQNHRMLMTAQKKRQFSIILVVQCRAVERDNFNDCRIDTKCTFFPANIYEKKKKHFMLLTNVIVT